MADRSSLALAPSSNANVQLAKADGGLADKETIGTVTAHMLYALADSGMTDLDEMMLLVEMRLASIKATNRNIPFE